MGQVEPSCLICSAKLEEHWARTRDVEYFTLDGDFDFFYCRQCGVLCIHPCPVDQLDELYPSNYYSFDGSLDSPIYRVKEWLDGRLFKKLLKELPQRPLKALDVGGGSGWMLQTLARLDPRVTHTQVVDLDLETVEKARANGHGAFHGAIEDFDTQERYDLILMLSLIEHVHNPLEVLEKVGRLLTPEGMVLIKTPNFDSWDHRLFRHQHWAGYHCPRHWVLFTRESLERCALQAGLSFKHFSYTQGAPFWSGSLLNWLSVRGWIRVSRDRPMLHHPLSNPLLGLFAAFDLLRGRWSKTSQMFVVLERRD